MLTAEAFPCIHCQSSSHNGVMHVEMYGDPTPSPVPVNVNGNVTIGNAVRTNEEAADYGAYSTFAVTATDAPIRIAGHDDMRSRIRINTDTNNVWIGKREQIFASVGAQGILVGTSGVEVRNKQEIWMAPNGQPCNVSILVERWAS